METMRPLIAYSDANSIRIDGHRFGSWVRRLPGGTVVYADSLFKQEHYANMVEEVDDYAIGAPGNITGAKLRAKDGGRITILAAEQAWGYRGDNPDDLYDYILARHNAITGLGYEWRPTAGGIVSQLLKHTGKRIAPPPLQLRSRIHAAVHCGPMMHIRAGGPMVFHADLRAAFLDVLYEPLPDPSSQWIRTDKPERADLVVGNAWSTDEGPAFGPLPVAVYERMEYPTGFVRGAWFRPSFEMATEFGAAPSPDAEMYRVTRKSAWLAPLADRLAAILTADKETAKSIYTRVWGKLTSFAHWQATAAPVDGNAIPRGGLWWSYYRKDLDEEVYGNSYRPDVGGWIASLNFARVMRAAMRRHDTIVAAHVDALWSKPKPAVRTGGAIGDWVHKGSGPVVYARQGIYSSEWATGAMGFRTEVQITPTLIRRLLERDRGVVTSTPLNTPVRQWSADPAISDDAVSYVLHGRDEPIGQLNIPGVRR